MMLCVCDGLGLDYSRHRRDVGQYIRWWKSLYQKNEKNFSQRVVQQNQER